MARSNPCDDALVVHDKCVPRVRQCTTLEKGLSRIIARDRALKVASVGEVMPFSILDSMPAESLAALASSTTVISSFLRNARTSRPIATLEAVVAHARQRVRLSIGGS